MKLHYYGHSAFRITGENCDILIDPFLMDNPLCKTDPQNLNGISHIMVTHGHGDHIGDTIEIAKKCNSLVVSNFELSLWFGSKGLKTHPMHIGGAFNFDFGRVKMTTATHGSGIQTENGIAYGGNPCGFLIETDGKKIYHAGDTGLTQDMKLLEIENIDYALLPIGGNFTMDAADAARAVDFIKPKAAIPMHYNTFPLIEVYPELFKASVENSSVIILEPNTAMVI